MENTTDADIFETTRLLKAWGEGDETAQAWLYRDLSKGV